MLGVLRTPLLVCDRAVPERGAEAFRDRIFVLKGGQVLLQALARLSQVTKFLIVRPASSETHARCKCTTLNEKLTTVSWMRSLLQRRSNE